MFLQKGTENLVEIKLDDRKLALIRKRLKNFPRAMPKVMSRGINRTATSARTKARRLIAKELGVKQKIIAKGITLKRATYSRWRADLQFAGKRIPLHVFGARQTAKGVSISTGTGKTTGFYPGAFIAQMQSGHVGVFKRVEDSRIRKPRKKKFIIGTFRRNDPSAGRFCWPALPIYELDAVSVGGYLAGDAAGVVDELVEESGKDLEKNIDDQVRMILEKN